MGYPVVSVIVKSSNSVELYDAKGSYLKSISESGIIGAAVNGGVITISVQGGRAKLYDAKNGSYMKSIG